MSASSDYCKAYAVDRLRVYPDWREADAGEPLAPDSCVFLHENLVVTRGIYKDEQVVFDRVTDQWRAFCDNELGFNVPPLD